MTLPQDACLSPPQWQDKSHSMAEEHGCRRSPIVVAADSSNLIDSPAAAARRGVHRTLLYREETGTFTRFRPYGPPTDEWLHGVRTGLTPRRPLQPAIDLDGFHVT